MRFTRQLWRAAVTPSSAPFDSSTRGMTRIKDSSSRRKWVDSLRVFFRGGNGGHGYPPRGGVGGRGGDCIVEAVDDKKVPNLHALFSGTFKGDSKQQQLHAQNGSDASKTRVLGLSGDHAVLKVPIGLCVTTDEGKVLADLNKHGDFVLVAVGGEGGGPNTDWMGRPGQRQHLRLDLKLIADVGLVGFPNAGKSTLLKAISKANPKIANYPFTTIKPNLGHLEYEDLRKITMADLPGLIEGAHYNIGMGHRFLKHVERTRMLLFVIDVNGFRLNPHTHFRSAFETVALLNRELELYRSDLIDKPAVCLINKMDADGATDKFKQLEKDLEEYSSSVNRLDEDMRPQRLIKFSEIIPMSAKFSQKSVLSVKDKVRAWLDEHAQEQLEPHSAIRTLSVLKNQEDGPILA